MYARAELDDESAAALSSFADFDFLKPLYRLLAFSPLCLLAGYNLALKTAAESRKNRHTLQDLVEVCCSTLMIDAAYIYLKCRRYVFLVSLMAMAILYQQVFSS